VVVERFTGEASSEIKPDRPCMEITVPAGVKPFVHALSELEMTTVRYVSIVTWEEC
jgi:hypothetical protein